MICWLLLSFFGPALNGCCCYYGSRLLSQLQFLGVVVFWTGVFVSSILLLLLVCCSNLLLSAEIICEFFVCVCVNGIFIRDRWFVFVYSNATMFLLLAAF